MDNGIITHYSGTAIKSLGEGRFGGYLVIYGDETRTDLANEFFTAETDYGISHGDKTTIYWHHNLDDSVKGKIGSGILKPDKVGVWLDGVLEIRDEYLKKIMSLIEAGKAGLSSGTAGHLIERQAVGKATWIKSWPLGLDASITPTPCEPRTSCVPLKSLREGDSTNTSTGSKMDQGAMTLADHTTQVVSDIEDYIVRVKDYAAMKAAEDRKVSRERRESFAILKGLLEEVIILSEPKPDPGLAAMKLRLLKEKLGR